MKERLIAVILSSDNVRASERQEIKDYLESLFAKAEQLEARIVTLEAK